MNSVLSKVYKEHVLHYTDIATKGYAKREMGGAIEYLDKVYRAATEAANIGLVYVGCHVLSVNDRINAVLNRKSPPRVHDIQKTTMVPYKFMFEYDGSAIDIVIAMPVLSDGGIFMISDTHWVTKPVWTNTLITINQDSLLLILLRDKIDFYTTAGRFIYNKNLLHREIVYGDIFKIKTNSNNLGKVFPPVSLYIFCYRGVMETFEHYCGERPVIATVEKEEELASKGYNILKSTGIPYKGLQNKNVMRNDMIVAFKKETEIMMQFASSLMYMFDVFPNIAVRYGEEINSGGDDKEFSIYLLSRILFKDDREIDIGIELTKEHLEAISTYIDPISKERALEVGLEIETFEDMLYVMQTRYYDWKAKALLGKSINSKYLNVFYYIFYNYVVGLNKVIIDIRKFKTKGLMTQTKIKRCFNKHLGMVIYRLTSGGGNIAIEYCSVLGDTMVPKLTLPVELQDMANGVTKKPSATLPYEATKVTGRDVFASNPVCMPKSAVTPMVNLNPYQEFSGSGRMILSESEKNEMEQITKELMGHV